MGLMLGDDGGQQGKLGDLMPGRFRIVGAKFRRQRCLATGASLRDIRNDDVDPRLRQPDSVMALMAVLTTAPPSGASLDNRLGSVQGIGRRRRGAIGGVALNLREEFFVLSFKHGDPG